MQKEQIIPKDNITSALGKSAGMSAQVHPSGRYVAECFGADGKLKWRDTIENLVTTVGKNDALDKYFEGSSYTAAWYMGLVDAATTPTYAAADTMASHAGWTESAAYANATRPAAVWSAAAAASKALSTALSFNINASATIGGCFMVTNSTKSGTTGILYSCGNFTGGNKAVASGDTLNVSYTSSLT